MFKFDLGQRVNVPHFINVQGVVTSRADGIGIENRYNLDWLTDLMRSSGGFSESEMLLANAESKGWAHVGDEVHHTPLHELAKLIGRPRPHRKRKPVRKAKPKRKR